MTLAPKIARTGGVPDSAAPLLHEAVSGPIMAQLEQVRIALQRLASSTGIESGPLSAIATPHLSEPIITAHLAESLHRSGERLAAQGLLDPNDQRTTELISNLANLRDFVHRLCCEPIERKGDQSEATIRGESVSLATVSLRQITKDILKSIEGLTSRSGVVLEGGLLPSSLLSDLGPSSPMRP